MRRDLITELFRAQAKRTPDAVAVEKDGQRLSYRELDERANRLACGLRSQGVGRETRVAVFADSSLDLIVAICAIWKAGGAYLPLDPRSPVERLSFMLEESQPAVVLTDARLAQHLPQAKLPVFCVDQLRAQFGPEHTAGPLRDACASDLAYVMYTSGSSGRPKAVEIEHRGLGNLLRAQIELLEVGPGDRILQFASLAFDASIAEIIMALGSGATLCLSDQARFAGPTLVDVLCDERISCAILPPSVLATLPFEPLPELRTLNVAGEKCPSEVVDRWAPGRRFFNHYGPTEATVWASVDRCEPGRAPTLGKAIPGVELHVLDESLSPVPVGGVGEIFIGGAGVGRGYTNRPELTAARFINSPFDGSRLYRSGDRARRLENGNLEFVGRLDQQVKLRGHRIELGEIEAVLAQHAGVSAVAVIARGDTLCAYLARRDAAPSPADLEIHVRRKLPDYMLPSAFVVLDSLPRTLSGKLDRAALPVVPLSSGAGKLRGSDEVWLADQFAEILGVEEIGPDDDFFALGGHSLSAARLLSAIREHRNVTIGFDRFTEASTVAALAREIRATDADDSASTVIRPAGHAAVSAGQRRLWLIEQLDPGRAIYNAPLWVEFTGPRAGDVETIARSLERIVRRHEVLRTMFATVAGEPELRVIDSLPVAPMVDLRGLPESAQRETVDRHRLEEIAQPFDLTEGPLLRATLFRLREDQTALLLVAHHMVMDGWSVGVLLRELVTLYEGLPIEELPIQYRDFAAWEQVRLTDEVVRARLAFWSRQLAELTPLSLPTDRSPSGKRTRRGARIPIRIEESATRAVGELARSERSTPFMVLLAAFDLLLARYCGQTDITVGTPIANRQTRQTEDVIGFFANTLVLRADLSGDPTFRALVSRVRRGAVDAYAHADLPFDRVAQAIGSTRMRAESLFRVLFVFENIPLPVLEREGFTVRFETPHNGTAMYDLTLSIEDRDGELRGYFEYDVDLFDAESVERIAESFHLLLSQLPARCDQPISRFTLLSECERRRVLTEWNQTARRPLRLPIHEWFIEQARQTPGESAVVGPDGQSLDYRELDRRSNQLAHHLSSLGACGKLVALSLMPSLDMAVGVLGTLKAGAACVPLDPTYPRERLEFMLAETGATVLLTHVGACPAFLSEAGNLKVVHLDSDAPLLEQHPRTPSTKTATLDDRIYVLYTSGSTGRPKGVVMPHRAIANLISWHIRAVPGRATTLQLAPLSFDVSFQEMFSTWCSGGNLVLAAPTIRTEPDELGALIAERRIERVFLPVVLLQRLAERFCDDSASLGTLRHVFVAGERLRITREIRRLFAALPDCDLHNHYGPTEAHVVTAHRLAGDRTVWSNFPPIGKPVDNSRIYLLDSVRQPVPAGVTGEVFIAGECLAHGYLDQPALTAERFIPAPAGISEALLYRTGDEARWRNDGTLEFLGRVDRQLKIRGHRVEPGEIEAVLLEDERVSAAAIVARDTEQAGPQLVAYVVTGGAGIAAAEIKAGLRKRLPEPMIPTEVVFVASLPLGPNGKVDLSALPIPVPRRVEHAEAPTDRERRIAAIWAAVIGLSNVAVEDDFLEVGGHSLLAMQIATRISRAFGVRMRPREIFEHPTVASQAARVEQLLRRRCEGHDDERR